MRHALQPLAKLPGKTGIVERKPALVDDEQGRPAVEPVFDAVEKPTASSSLSTTRDPEYHRVNARRYSNLSTELTILATLTPVVSDSVCP